MRKAVAVLLASLMGGAAFAAPINWVASGYIDFTRDPELLPLTPQVGDLFSYSVVFDDAIPDENPFENGAYRNAILSATLSIGGESYDVPLGIDHTLYVTRDPAGETYGVSFSTEEHWPGTYPSLRVEWSYWLPWVDAPDSDAIPAVPPSAPAPYTSILYLFEYQNEEQGMGTEPIPLVTGVVTSIVVQPTSVPEPTSLALFAAGLVGLGVIRRRRR